MKSIIGAAVVSMLCSPCTSSSGSESGGTEASAALPCPGMPVAEAGYGYYPPSDLPSGTACDTAEQCTIVTATPCPNPIYKPPASTWNCQCVSGVWVCDLLYTTHSYCPPGDASSE